MPHLPVPQPQPQGGKTGDDGSRQPPQVGAQREPQRRTAELLRREVEPQSYDKKARDDRGAAVAQKRHGDAGEGHQVEGPTDDHEQLSPQHGNQPGRQQRAKTILLPPCDSQPAQQQNGIDQQNGHRPHRPHLFRNGGKDQIGIYGRDVIRRSHSQAGSGQPAGRDGIERLQGLVAQAFIYRLCPSILRTISQFLAPWILPDQHPLAHH